MKKNGTNMTTTEPNITVATPELTITAPDDQSVQSDAFCREHYHCSPAMFRNRRMIQSACLKLSSTNDDPAETAAQCGFSDARHFCSLFRDAIGMTPEAYRHALRNPTDSFQINLSEDYRLIDCLRMQARDKQSICERLDGSTLAKAVIINGKPLVITINAADQRTLDCRVEAPEALGHSGTHCTGIVEPGDIAAAINAILRMIGMHPDPQEFEDHVLRNLQNTPVEELIRKRPNLRIPQTATVFECLAWAVIGQQINLSFAFQLRRSLTEIAGRKTSSGLITHPSAAEVAALDYGDLQKLKYSRRKAEYLIDLARLIVSGKLPAEELPQMTFPQVNTMLQSIRGIGEWSANYVAMRSCGFMDCVPLGDTGLTSGLQKVFGLSKRPDRIETVSLMEVFRPYRSFGTFHLWQEAGGGA
jgi:AraC family transcriptional regulator of adaptative response / DNA-3-methyladenine glycosylase II